MSEQQPGLSTNPANINPTGANPQALKEYQDSLEAQIKSLEDRYSNPNWFKVAAGFLKPQLGGFAASLGSASEALGENVEAGRAAALPIAQMRSQLAQSRILTGQNKDVSDAIKQYKLDHPGEEIPASKIAEWQGIAPNLPDVQSLAALQKTNLEQRQLAHSQFADAMARVQFQRSLPNGHPDPADLAIISGSQGAQKAPIETPKPDAQTNVTSVEKPAQGGGTGFSGTASQIVDSINAITDPAERQAAMDQYLRQLGITPASKAGPNQSASAPAGAQPKTAAKTGPSWDDPNYPIAPPPGYQGLSDVAVQEARKANVTSSQNYVDEIASLANNPATLGRTENLKKIASLVQDPDVQTWIARNDPSRLSSIVKNALVSGSVPDFIAQAVGGTKSILPTDKPEMVEKVQQYMQSLAKEKEYVNNLTANPTNAKSHFIADSAVTADMQPKTVMQTIAEELHKTQKLVNLPYILSPYAKQGYTVADMLGSDRMHQFNKQWTETHQELPYFSKKMVLPKSLTVSEAFLPGFNQESLRK
jgi:hypothetical protein